MTSFLSTASGRRFLLGVVATSALACSGDKPMAPPDEVGTVLNGMRGDLQISTAGTEVPLPLTLRVRSARGAPLKGKSVTWIASDGGSVVAERAVTDDSGTVRATWTLGPSTGRQSAVATVRDSAYRFFATAASALPLGELRPMTLVTFDGSGQVVHPDIVRVPRGWAPARRFLVITPYPFSDRKMEEPSLYASGDVAAWEPPSGAKNPLARAAGTNYLSDPDAVFDPDGKELYLYYREVTNSRNRIHLIRSLDGVHWSSPTQVLSAPNHEIISQTVVRSGAREWHMWAVNAGNAGCSAPSTVVEHRTSVDGLHWSAARRTDMRDAPRLPWHIDVTWVPDRREFWALFNGKPEDSCSTPALYLATSPDGITWHTYPSPVIEKGVIPEFKDIVYRATMEFDSRSDVVTIWVSGAAYLGRSYVWSSAVERVDRSTLFAGAERPVSLRRLVAPSSAPKLMIAP